MVPRLCGRRSVPARDRDAVRVGRVQRARDRRITALVTYSAVILSFLAGNRMGPRDPRRIGEREQRAPSRWAWATVSSLAARGRCCGFLGETWQVGAARGALRRRVGRRPQWMAARGHSCPCGIVDLRTARERARRGGVSRDRPLPGSSTPGYRPRLPGAGACGARARRKLAVPEAGSSAASGSSGSRRGRTPGAPARPSP